MEWTFILCLANPIAEIILHTSSGWPMLTPNEYLFCVQLICSYHISILNAPSGWPMFMASQHLVNIYWKDSTFSLMYAHWSSSPSTSWSYMQTKPGFNEKRLKKCAHWCVIRSISSHCRFSTARSQAFTSGSLDVCSNMSFIQAICNVMLCSIMGADTSSARLTEVVVEDFGLCPWGFLWEPPDNEAERRGCDELWRPNRDGDDALGCSGRGCVITKGDNVLKSPKKEHLLGISSAGHLNLLKWLLIEGEAEAGWLPWGICWSLLTCIESLVINDFGQMAAPNKSSAAVLDKCARVCLCRQRLIEEIYYSQSQWWTVLCLYSRKPNIDSEHKF